MNGRVEVITGPERRRRWSDEEKLQLVAEACQPGNSVSQVARKRGISASQLFGWRRQMLAKGFVTDNRSEPSVPPALTFAPVEIATVTESVVGQTITQSMIRPASNCECVDEHAHQK